MANTNSADGGGEKLQIAILTFFMTAGGFLILTLWLTLYLNPRLDARMKSAERDYEALCELLQQDDVRRLRQHDRENQEKGGEQDLQTLISENLTKYGLQYREFRQPRTTQKKGGIIEIAQQITLLPARMTPILQFVAAVQASRKSIHVSSLDFTRNKRAAAGEDSWQAGVLFIDYELGGGSR